MPSKKAIKLMKHVRSKGVVTRGECIAIKEDFVLDDLLRDGYLESLEPKYLDNNFNKAAPSLGPAAKFRLSDRGYEYLELRIDRVIDRWFTRSISVLALLVSLATLLLTGWN